MAIRILPGPALRERTTLKIGGVCRAELVVEREADAERLPDALGETGGRPLVLGWGSNILARDGELDIAVVTPALHQGPEAVRQSVMCDCDEAVFVRCGAGVRLPRLLAWLGAHGLSGLEGLAGVPGSVGGAMAMNAGSYGTEIGARMNRVRVFTEAHGLVWLGRADVELAYRHFAVKGLAPDALCVVLEVELALDLAPGCGYQGGHGGQHGQETGHPTHCRCQRGVRVQESGPGRERGKAPGRGGAQGLRRGRHGFFDPARQFHDQRGKRHRHTGAGIAGHGP